MMQMVQCLFVSLAGIAAFAHGQTVSLPGVPGSDYVVTGAEVACLRLANDFVAKYDPANTPPGTCTTPLGTPLWDKFKVGFTGSLFPEIQGTTSKATCDTAAALVTPGTDVAAAELMCANVDTITKACGCDKLSCVNDNVNTVINSTEWNACNAFPQKICRHFQTPVAAACTAAITAVENANVGTTKVYTASSVTATCTAADCKIAPTTVSLPGVAGSDVTVTGADVQCHRLALTFAEQYVQTTPPTTCTTALGTPLWNKFRVGFTGTLFPGIRTTTSKADCDTAADALGADVATAKLMCTNVDTITKACGCDKLSCVNDNVNTGITASEWTSGCQAFPQNLCHAFQTPVATACSTAITAVVNANVGATKVYSAASVTATCTAADCRIAPATPAPTSSTTTPSTTSGALRMPTIMGGGVYLAGAVVAAWVASIL